MWKIKENCQTYLAVDTCFHLYPCGFKYVVDYMIVLEIILMLRTYVGSGAVTPVEDNLQRQLVQVCELGPPRRLGRGIN